jgi:uncharacterized protein YndB with AHSA1/START domain
MTDRTITLSQTINATIETVFNAWVTPEILKTWYAPVEDWVVGHAEVEPGVGGHYRISFGPPPSGDAYTEEGTYTVFEPVQRLAWTGTVTDDTDDILEFTATFESLGERTIVTVTETGLSTAEAFDDHTGGWSTALAQLGAVLES